MNQINYTYLYNYNDCKKKMAHKKNGGCKLTWLQAVVELNPGIKHILIEKLV